MSKICIVSLGYMWFPIESGPSRFYQLAQTFAQKGYEVEIVTTDFQHFKKAPRDLEAIRALNLPFQIHFIEAKPYKKNIDVRRVLSNRDAAKKVVAFMKEHIKEYDIVYTSVPANDIAAEVSKICVANQVPFVVDVEDLWPEAMSMVVKNDTLRKIMFSSFQRDAETVYKNATAVVGTSEDYTGRAVKYNKRTDLKMHTTYVGCNLDDFDAGVDKFSQEIEARKNPEEFWISYAGSISTSYDIMNLIQAAILLAKTKDEKQYHFQILGTGSQKEELEKFVASEQISNVHFWGYTEYQKMAAVLSKSDLVINSFVKGAPQSIVNKVGDYLAAARPMLNTLENPVFTTLVDDGHFGVNLTPGDSVALANEIRAYAMDQKRLDQEGQNARALAETKFDRKVSYPELVDWVSELIAR